MKTLYSDALPPLWGDEQLWAYNALDCCITREVFDDLSEQLSQRNDALFAYDMPRAMQGPALEMMRRGCKIDLWARDKELTELNRQYDRACSLFTRITEEAFGRALNPRSNPDLHVLFHNCLGVPKVMIYDKVKRERRPSLNREALQKVRQTPVAAPFVALLTDIRGTKKLKEALEAGVDSDGRMRCSYNVTGTMTGRWSSNESALGSGCVPPGTEVLTPTGWLAIERVAHGTPVMQWEPKTGRLSFAAAEPFQTHYKGNLHRLSTEQVSQTLTAEHRVPFYDSRYNFTELPAATVAQRTISHIPLSGNYVSGQTKYPRLLAALMADGSKDDTGWRIALKKPGKIQRLFSLAEEAGIELVEQAAKPGYRRFRIRGFTSWPKVWGCWVLNTEFSCLWRLVEEARYWDGHSRGRSFQFFTADEQQAEWFSVAAHCVGLSTTTRHVVPHANSFAPHSAGCFTVNVKPRNKAQALRKHWSLVPYDGPVYCVTVPTSYFVARFDKRHISITGNTNLQNITDRARRMFIPDKGLKLGQIDLSQAESKAVAAISGDEAYRAATLSGDLHTHVAKLCWPELPWGTGDDKSVAKRVYLRFGPVEFTYRDMAKRAGHGTNYGGSAVVIAKTLRIPLKAAEEFQRAYFAAFPGIARWHRRVQTQLAINRTITTPLGRKCQFLGRATDSETLKSAIAYGPQSTIGDILNLGLYKVWRQFDQTGQLQLLLQVHDSIVFQYDPVVEATLLPAVQAALRTPVNVDGYLLDVASDVMVGWNWGKASNDNPFGLVEWHGTDTRKFVA
jgi:DNA polymerase I-like protein with 3'-5' exonuclease and polymerase domains